MKILIHFLIFGFVYGFIDSQFCNQEIFRLSSKVEPTFYTIKIQPDIDYETFSGEVSIHIKIHSSIKYIDFHSSKLHITKLYFDTEIVDNCYSSMFKFSYLRHEIVRISRINNRLFPPGSHYIQISYYGHFSNIPEGLFKAGITKNNQTLGYLLATDFEPTFARTVYPCFDEPSFKAKYQLNVVVPDSSYTVLSNMPVMEKVSVNDRILYKFQTTPPMSIYLLSFVVIQQSFKEYIDTSNNDIPFRIYSYKADEDNDKTLLKYASEFIKFYSNYTNFNYTLPKLDFVEFNRKTAATENWGLVTLNSGLLSSEEYFYEQSQKLTVIAHELAHFWFGNLVTNAWWDDIWLQESLATFMAVKAEEAVLQNNASEEFITSIENLFFVEIRNSTKPVVHFEEIPQKMINNFNEITYFKGAAVLRMIEMVIGEENMRNALREYIKIYAFKTATTNDLITILTNYTNDVNLRQFIESYLYQNRFPVIRIEESGDYYGLSRQISFDIHQAPPSKWTIPVTFITNLNSTPTLVWFRKDEEQLRIPKNNASWIKLNPGQIGYYRVNYDKTWSNLISHIQELELTEQKNLILEAIGMYDLNLHSCNFVLQYLRNFNGNGGRFDVKLVYTIYYKLKEDFEQDYEAFENLKIFFSQLFCKNGKKNAAKATFSDQPENHNKIGFRNSKVVRDCKERIESYVKESKYYNATELKLFCWE